MKKEGDHFDVSMGAYKGVEVCELKETPKNVFKNNGLGVITYCNMKIVNYLDIPFNLNDGTYRPYQKSDNIMQYMYVESNHPPIIMKQILKTIEKRFFHLSSTEEIFNEPAPFHGDKLQQSGH